MSIIESKYAQLGGRHSFLSMPEGEEYVGADGIGRLRRFQGGIICSNPTAGAHEIHGKILKKWLDMGAEKSTLGYPTSDVLVSRKGQGHCSCFQNGRIYSDFLGSIHITDLHSDKSALDWILFNATYLPSNWSEANKFDPSPISVDYSGDVVFTRTQGTKGGGGYGCITYSFLHILDILKHWEQPFSPAVSWHYAEWFCEEYKKSNPDGNPLMALADHGIAPEGHCRTNWDNEFKFVTNPKMISEHKFYYPFPTWDTPNGNSHVQAPLYRVKSDPLKSWVSAKPKDTAGGLLSPSVSEIKQLLRSCGPVITAGIGHAKAIIGYDDLKSEFAVLDSYIHNNNNFTSISYEKIGPSWLFTISDQNFTGSLDSLSVPGLLRDKFKEKGWPIPNQVVVTKKYDAAATRWLYWITADPKKINQINVVFLIEKKDNSADLNVYDEEIAWDYLAVESFAPVINLPDEKRLEAPFAYSARFRIADNWRGTFTVSVGVEGKQQLVVWTTRGRNLQNVKKTIVGIDVDWQTPLEVTRFLDIDIPLPDYAKDHWPPRKNHRWVLTVEDHDRDGVAGTLKEFTLAKRYIHPNCHSVGKYRTEIYGGALSIMLQDPTAGQTVSVVDMHNPPPEANQNPGVVKAYIPESISSIGTGTYIQTPPYSVELDKNTIIHPVPNMLHISGHLTAKLFSSPGSQPVSNKKIILMQLNTNNCKPYQWLPVLEQMTDSKGKFKFDLPIKTFEESFFGAAFFNDAGDQVLASSEVVKCKLHSLSKPVKVTFPALKDIKQKVPWPWNGDPNPVIDRQI